METGANFLHLGRKTFCASFSLILVFLLAPFTAGLGEFRIRDLNDEINKLLREKRHWQERIKDLGGPDYFVSGCTQWKEKVKPPGRHLFTPLRALFLSHTASWAEDA